MRRISTLQTLSNYSLFLNSDHPNRTTFSFDRLLTAPNIKNKMQPKSSTLDFLIQFSKNIVIKETKYIGNVEFFIS